MSPARMSAWSRKNRASFAASPGSGRAKWYAPTGIPASRACLTRFLYVASVTVSPSVALRYHQRSPAARAALRSIRPPWWWLVSTPSRVRFGG